VHGRSHLESRSLARIGKLLTLRDAALHVKIALARIKCWSAGNDRPKIRQRDGSADPNRVCRVGIYVPAAWLGLGNQRRPQSLLKYVGCLVTLTDLANML
jgi:hypothetical protein